MVTGDANGALSRAGAILLIALGLAATPLLASGIVGTTVLFGRRLRLGEFAEMGGTVARISAINLLEVRLVDVHRTELRVPHLLSLVRPLRVLGMRPRLSIDVPVAAAVPHEEVREILLAAGKKCGLDPKLDLLSFDADGARYRLSALCDSLDGRRALAETALADLGGAGIPLGRTRAVPELNANRLSARPAGAGLRGQHLGRWPSDSRLRPRVGAPNTWCSASCSVRRCCRSCPAR